MTPGKTLGELRRKEESQRTMLEVGFSSKLSGPFKYACACCVYSAESCAQHARLCRTLVKASDTAIGTAKELGHSHAHSACHVLIGFCLQNKRLIKLSQRASIKETNLSKAKGV